MILVLTGCGGTGNGTASGDDTTTTYISDSEPQLLVGEAIPVLTSQNEGMISYGFQNHSWVSRDDKPHVIIKDTTDGSEVDGGNAYFRLYSVDETGQWKKQFAITGVKEQHHGENSSLDGVMKPTQTGKDRLFLAYNDKSGHIVVRSYDYTSGQGWDSQPVEESIPFRSPLWSASRPSISMDTSGKLWLGFVASQKDVSPDQAVHRYVVMTHRSGGKWREISIDDLQQGATAPSQNDSRSLRVVASSSERVCVIAALDPEFWAFCNDKGEEADSWEATRIFLRDEATTTRREQNDRYTAHFKAIADGDGNIHFLTNNSQFHVYYAQYNHIQQRWMGTDMEQRIKVLTDNAVPRGTYMALSWSPLSHKVYIAYDVKFTQDSDSPPVGLARFSSYFTTNDPELKLDWLSQINWWNNDYLAAYDFAVKTGNPRLEMPERTSESGYLPMFQQITYENGTDGLAVYHLYGQ